MSKSVRHPTVHRQRLATAAGAILAIAAIWTRHRQRRVRPERQRHRRLSRAAPSPSTASAWPWPAPSPSWPGSWAGSRLDRRAAPNTWLLERKTWFAGPAPARRLQPRLPRDGRLPPRRPRRPHHRRHRSDDGRRRRGRLMAASGADRSMAGRTVLVTGGTGGIGRAAALALAGMGARVGITGRDRARTEAAAAAIRAADRQPGRGRLRGRPLLAGGGPAPRRRGPGPLPAAGRPGQQRRRLLVPSSRHG